MKTSDAMSVDEALNHADEWVKGQTFYPGSQGWRVVCAVLAAEVRRLRAGYQSYVDTIEDLHDEIGRLRAKLEPDQFWLHDDPENSFASTLTNLVQEHADNCVNDPNDFVGEEFRVMRSVRLPDITVKITGYTTDEEGDWDGWTWDVK